MTPRDITREAGHFELYYKRRAKVPVTFSPLSLTDLFGWWRADLGITLNGGDVSGWADQKSDNDLVQATASLQPLFVSGTPDKITYSIDDALRTAAFSGGDLSQPGEIWVVHALANTSRTASQFLAGGISSTKRWILFKGSVSVKDYRINNGSGLDGTITMDTNVHVGINVANTTSSALYIDGGTALASGDAGSEVLSGLAVGIDTDGSDAFDGDIYEVVMTDAVLSTANKNLMGNYMAGRYGFTWTDIT